MTTTTTTTDRTSGWVSFAGAIILLASFFNVMFGLTALANEDWAVLSPGGILVFDLTTLGWTLLIIGSIQLVVGFGVLAGATWARVLGVAGAFLSFVASGAWLSVYPLWSLTIMVLDALVIYALLAHGDEVA